jgi:hypothetical protein
MNSALKEVAVTRFQGPLGGTWTKTNNIWIWVVLLFVFFAFTNGDGFGSFGGGCGRRHHHHHHKHHRRDNGIFGENGWFILIIFAALFLLNDGVGGANTNIINVDTEDAPTC